jgi:hypothetical protein
MFNAQMLNAQCTPQTGHAASLKARRARGSGLAASPTARRLDQFVAADRLTFAGVVGNGVHVVVELGRPRLSVASHFLNDRIVNHVLSSTPISSSGVQTAQVT